MSPDTAKIGALLEMNLGPAGSTCMEAPRVRSVGARETDGDKGEPRKVDMRFGSGRARGGSIFAFNSIRSE